MPNNVQAIAAKTWHVDDDGADYSEANFTTIQDAITASSDGDIIIVYDGTYQENIIINKSIVFLVMSIVSRLDVLRIRRTL
jgi:pectin methylesterase-like acyl-CoA thioesterase